MPSGKWLRSTAIKRLRKVNTTGDTLYVAPPTRLIEELGWKDGQCVRCSIVDGGIFLEPVSLEEYEAERAKRK